MSVIKAINKSNSLYVYLYVFVCEDSSKTTSNARGREDLYDAKFPKAVRVNVTFYRNTTTGTVDYQP